LVKLRPQSAKILKPRFFAISTAAKFPQRAVVIPFSLNILSRSVSLSSLIIPRGISAITGISLLKSGSFSKGKIMAERTGSSARPGKRQTIWTEF
jgi:hypothetical protein